MDHRILFVDMRLNASWQAAAKSLRYAVGATLTGVIAVYTTDTLYKDSPKRVAGASHGGK
jgi:hypothetical protein